MESVEQLRLRVDAKEKDREHVMMECQLLLKEKATLLKTRDKLVNQVQSNVDVTTLEAETKRRYQMALELLNEIEKLELHKEEFIHRICLAKEKEELRTLQNRLNRISVGPPASTLEGWYQSLQSRSMFESGVRVSYPVYRRTALREGMQEDLGFTVMHSGICLALKVHQHHPGSSKEASHAELVTVDCDLFLPGLQETVQDLVLSGGSLKDLLGSVRKLLEKESDLAFRDPAGSVS